MGAPQEAASKAAEPSPTPEPGMLPTSEETSKAKSLVAQMSDSELAGAVIMADAPSTDPDQAAALVRDKNLGGIIVMKYNLPATPTPAAVKKLTGAVRDASGDRGWDPVIGVDQEGGPVSRLGPAAYAMPPMMAHGAADRPELTTQAIAAQAEELRDLGFTMDFAPAADVTIGKEDPAINVRSASDDPARAARAVTAAVEGFNEAGLGSSVKHFPGHGSVNVDTHEGLGVLGRDREQLKKTDLPPMKAGVDAGSPVVMIGHMAMKEEPKLPSSLNPKAYEYLRSQLKFDGVVVTDALNMGAVKTKGNPAVAAIKAGADLALLPPDPAGSQEAMLAALKSGDLKRDRLTGAAERVVAMQLASARTLAEATPEVPDSSRQDLADAALTVVAGQCQAEPAEQIRVVGGEPKRRKAMEKAAEAAGLGVGTGGTSVAVVGTGAPPSADVVVGVGGPWSLGASNAKTTLAAYAETPEAYRSVAEYLAGSLKASGSLPVKVGGAEPPDCG